MAPMMWLGYILNGCLCAQGAQKYSVPGTRNKGPLTAKRGPDHVVKAPPVFRFARVIPGVAIRKKVRLRISPFCVPRHFLASI